MDGLRMLIREIHRRSLWQVLGIYLAASWAALQVVQTVVATAGLPEWLPGMAVVLLVIGLPIVLATAFVQEGIARSDASPDEGFGDGETSAESGVTTALFTWLNALLGGVAAFALWGVVATALLLRGVGAAVDSGERMRIAVLPFENMASADNQFFTDGMHADVITALTKADFMDVIGRTSVLAFADPATRPGIPEIATRLDVDFVLEGTVQRSEDRVLVSTALIDVTDGGVLWTDQYDQTLSDVFGLQARLARDIASQLGTTLAPAAAERLERIPTENAEAYDLYVRARDLTGIRSDGGLALVARALELDPGFPEAWALASNHRSSAFLYALDRTAENLAAALAEAERSLRLDPDLPEGHQALGLYYYRAELRGGTDSSRQSCGVTSRLRRCPQQRGLGQSAGGSVGHRTREIPPGGRARPRERAAAR